jgi:hypothetical protein
MTNIKITLPNGVTLEGESVIVVKTAQSLGHDFSKDSSWYFSESKGTYIYIPSMVPEYIRNAFLKRLAKVESIYAKKLDNKQFCDVFRNSAYVLQDKILQSFLTTLGKKI